MSLLGGGHVGYALGRLAPDRVTSLIRGGPTAFGGDPRPTTGAELLEGRRKGMAGLTPHWVTEFPACWIWPGERDRILAADAETLAAARLAHLPETELPDDAMATRRIPTERSFGTLGELELVERAAHLVPNATFIAGDGAASSARTGRGG